MCSSWRRRWWLLVHKTEFGHNSYSFYLLVYLNTTGIPCLKLSIFSKNTQYGYLYNSACICLNKLLKCSGGRSQRILQVRSVNIISAYPFRTPHTFLHKRRGKKITIIILSQFISTTNQSPLTFIFRSFLFIFHSPPPRSLSHPPIHLHTLEIYKHPPPPPPALPFL
jgi:hypothetical protein